MGQVEAEIDGHKVKIVSLEKSVCDAVKFRNKIGTEVTVEILKNYLRRPDRNIALLMDFTKKMRVRSTIEQYLAMGV